MYLSGDAEDEHEPRGVLEALEGPGVLAAVVGRLLLGNKERRRVMRARAQEKITHPGQKVQEASGTPRKKEKQRRGM